MDLSSSGNNNNNNNNNAFKTDADEDHRHHSNPHNSTIIHLEGVVEDNNPTIIDEDSDDDWLVSTSIYAIDMDRPHENQVEKHANEAIGNDEDGTVSPHDEEQQNNVQQHDVQEDNAQQHIVQEGTSLNPENLLIQQSDLSTLNTSCGAVLITAQPISQDTNSHDKVNPFDVNSLGCNENNNDVNKDYNTHSNNNNNNNNSNTGLCVSNGNNSVCNSNVDSCNMSVLLDQVILQERNGELTISNYFSPNHHHQKHYSADEQHIELLDESPTVGTSATTLLSSSTTTNIQLSLGGEDSGSNNVNTAPNQTNTYDNNVAIKCPRHRDVIVSTELSDCMTPTQDLNQSENDSHYQTDKQNGFLPSTTTQTTRSPMQVVSFQDDSIQQSTVKTPLTSSMQKQSNCYDNNNSQIPGSTTYNSTNNNNNKSNSNNNEVQLAMLLDLYERIAQKRDSLEILYNDTKSQSWETPTAQDQATTMIKQHITMLTDTLSQIEKNLTTY